jgi:predicted aspartyl protease
MAGQSLPPFKTSAGEPHEARTEVLKFDLYRGYLILVRGSVGGVNDLNFLVDTGTNPSIVDRRLADRLRLERQVGRVQLANTTMKSETAMLSGIELNIVRSERLVVLVQDLSLLEESLKTRIDGVIGLDVLGKNGLTINYATKTLRLGRPSRMAHSAPLTLAQKFATVDAILNARRFRLLVDTGASSVTLFASRIREIVPELQVLNETSSLNLAGRLDRTKVILRSMTLGQNDLGEVKAFLVQDQQDPACKFDGLLSPAALGFQELGLDFEEGILTWR